MRCDHELCACTEGNIRREGKYFCSDACASGGQSHKACACEHTGCVASREQVKQQVPARST
jgi:hypothetical protein